ncbi:DDE_3 domain-containing protein [Trichonephila clavipes]|uniref:DDE_3 domain-containing protein n=1 Tax=Trichonephila clavipes TaxID=2585209 RepID=A0A8X6R3I3_TRICX|nr:DDE_3 domain-containing protein [Trichonephila clavipes]
METVSGYQIRRKKSGKSCRRASTAREDHYLSIIPRSNRDASASLLSPELNTAIGTQRDAFVPHVRLFTDGVGPDFILLEDNNSTHRANLVDEFLESEDIRRIGWSARSPDLNLLKNGWNALGQLQLAPSTPRKTTNA